MKEDVGARLSRRPSTPSRSKMIIYESMMQKKEEEDMELTFHPLINEYDPVVRAFVL